MNKNNVFIGGPKMGDFIYLTVILKSGFNFADLVSLPNTKYIVKWNFDLNGETITIPENCIIEIDGGSLTNGTLIGNETILLCYQEDNIILKNVILDGIFIRGGIGGNTDKKDNENGMGTLTIVENKSIFEQIVKEGFIYIIRHNIDLESQTLTIPENCIIEFRGGSLNNGTIVGNNTIIKALPVKIFGLNITLDGTWLVEKAYCEWFKSNNDIDNHASILKVIDNFNQWNLLPNITYRTAETILIHRNNTKIYGASRSYLIYTSTDGALFYFDIDTNEGWSSVRTFLITDILLKTSLPEYENTAICFKSDKGLAQSSFKNLNIYYFKTAFEFTDIDTLKNYAVWDNLYENIRMSRNKYCFYSSSKSSLHHCFINCYFDQPIDKGVGVYLINMSDVQFISCNFGGSIRKNNEDELETSQLVHLGLNARQIVFQCCNFEDGYAYVNNGEKSDFLSYVSSPDYDRAVLSFMSGSGSSFDSCTFLFARGINRKYADEDEKYNDDVRGALMFIGSNTKLNLTNSRIICNGENDLVFNNFGTNDFNIDDYTIRTCNKDILAIAQTGKPRIFFTITISDKNYRNSYETNFRKKVDQKLMANQFFCIDSNTNELFRFDPKASLLEDNEIKYGLFKKINYIIPEGTTATEAGVSNNEGLFYYNTDLKIPVMYHNNKWINATTGFTAARIRGNSENRPTELNQGDEGYCYFDTDLKKPIYVKSINNGEVEWVDSNSNYTNIPDVINVTNNIVNYAIETFSYNENNWNKSLFKTAALESNYSIEETNEICKEINSIPLYLNFNNMIFARASSTVYTGKGESNLMIDTVPGEANYIYNLIPNQEYTLYGYYTDESNNIKPVYDYLKNFNIKFKTKGSVRLLHVEGVNNVRDLGGWRTIDGTYVRYLKIIRGGHICNITDKGKYTLNKNLNVRTIINLASGLGSDSEYFKVKPYDIEFVGGSDYELGYVTLYSSRYKDTIANINNNSGKNEVIANIFSKISERISTKGSIYIHCELGRDRTGIVCILLLGLLGVSISDILKEYDISYIYHYSDSKVKENNEDPESNEMHIFNFASEYIRELQGKYKGNTFRDTVKNYLLDCLNEDEKKEEKLDKIITNLTVDISKIKHIQLLNLANNEE